MDSITFENVMPAAFSRQQPASELWGKSVVFERGKTYLLEAASGTGKSSLCAYVYGYRHDYSGRIMFDNKVASSLGSNAWRQLRLTSVSLLFQELRLFDELTAWENVKLKNDLTGYKSADELRNLFEVLGIGDKTDTLARLMSFGQRQRVAFIRALCQPFDFILLDEPVSHLDESNAATLATLLTYEVRERGAAAIVTSVGQRLMIDYDKKIAL